MYVLKFHIISKYVKTAQEINEYSKMHENPTRIQCTFILVFCCLMTWSRFTKHCVPSFLAIVSLLSSRPSRASGDLGSTWLLSWGALTDFHNTGLAVHFRFWGFAWGDFWVQQFTIFGQWQSKHFWKIRVQTLDREELRWINVLIRYSIQHRVDILPDSEAITNPGPLPLASTASPLSLSTSTSWFLSGLAGWDMILFVFLSCLITRLSE